MAFDTLIFDPSASDTLVLDGEGADWLVLVAERIAYAAQFITIQGASDLYQAIHGAGSGYTLSIEGFPPFFVVSGTYDGLLALAGTEDRYGLVAGAFDGFTLVAGANVDQELSVGGYAAISGTTNQLSGV